MSSFGKANHEGVTRRKYFNLEDGDNVYRVLPPFGSLASKGKYIQYYSVVWGYKDSQGKNTPFSDYRVVNFKTKMVEVESPAYLRSKKLESTYDMVAKKSKEEGGKNPETQKLLADLAEQKKQFNLENKYFLNVMNLQGEVGLLKIGAKAKEQLVNLIKKLDSEGVDATSLDNGRFFNFNRMGKNRETQYTVSVYKEKIQTEQFGLIEKDKVSKITEAEASRIAKEAFDLGTLYTVPTTEQLDRIVTNREPVDLVLGLKRNAPSTATAASSSEEHHEAEVEETSGVAESAPEPTPAPASKASTVDAQAEADLLASLKELGI
jgi:hypothetical protein